jgi:hypothetical protein
MTSGFELVLRWTGNNMRAPAMTGIARSIKNLHWSQWLAILGLVALFVALRWNNYAAPLGRDEGEYAYAAQLLMQGIAPYQHAFLQKPPGVFYTYLFSDLLLPHVYWSPRLLAALFIAVTTILLGLIARWEFGERAAWPAMWLATPMVLLPELDQVAASVEAFMLLPLMATVVVYCYSRQHGHQDKHWFATGFLAATTLIYKYTALPILAFLFVAWLFEQWKNSGKTNAVFRAMALALAGGILASALGLAFFLIHDGGKTFWECTVRFNRYYASSNLFSRANFWSWVEDFWTHWWILFLIPWMVLLRPGLRILFWLGMFICAVVATNGGCYGQYYMAMMPFWALLSVAGICALASRLPGPATCLITVVVVALVIDPDVPWMLRTSEQFAGIKMGEAPFIEALLVATEVNQMSSPGDFVYVAGSEPEIYYYAQRFSPTRFVTSYAQMDPNPLAPGYQQEAMNDLQQHPPKLIVFVQTGSSWTRQAASPQEFINFIGQYLQGYDLVGGFVKAEPPKGYWTTNLNAAEYKSSSLLLYRRKAE